MSRKCGASTIDSHLRRVAAGKMAPHVYSGPYTTSGEPVPTTPDESA